MNIKKLGFIFLVLISLVGLFSCNQLIKSDFDESETTDIVSAKMAHVSFKISDTARTIMPTVDLPSYTYEVFGSKNNGTLNKLIAKTSHDNFINSNITIAPGKWTFIVNAYDSADNLILTGKTEKTLNGGSQTESISLMLTAAVGEGSVNVTLTFPSEGVSKVYANVSDIPYHFDFSTATPLTITPVTNSDLSKVTFTSGNLQSGKSQFLIFVFFDEFNNMIGHYSESIYILPNTTSTKEITIDEIKDYVNYGPEYYIWDYNRLWTVLESELSENTTAKIVIGYKIPADDIKSIGYAASRRNLNLAVDFSSSGITKLEQSAFGWDVEKGIIAVILPETLTEIQFAAFDKCGDLQSVTIPKSLTNIANAVFAGCTNLKFSVHKDNPKYTASPDGKMLLSKDGKTLYAYPSAEGTISNLPTTITEIYAGAFKHAKNLESITLSSNISSIGGDAFCGCTSLTEITLPANTEIESAILNDCKNLTSITVTGSGKLSVSTINGKPLLLTDSGRTLLEWPSANGDIEIPSGITKISAKALAYTKVTSVTIPSSVTTIETMAFLRCDSLTTFITNGNSTFSSNSDGMLIENGNKLISWPNAINCNPIIFPDYITTIGSHAIYGCISGGCEVIIPRNITKLEKYALGGNWPYPSPVIIFESTTPPTLVEESLGMCGFDKIYVPADAVSSYKSASAEWKKYSDKILPTHDHWSNAVKEYYEYDYQDHYCIIFCTTCGKELSRYWEPHTFEEQIIYGTKYNVCIYCGYEEEMHVHNRGHYYYSPNDENKHKKIYYCTICGMPQDYELEDHNFDSGYDRYDEDFHWKEYKCVICDDTKKEDITAHTIAINNSYDTIYHYDGCTGCEYIASIEFHIWNEGERNGDTIEYICTVCNEKSFISDSSAAGQILALTDSNLTTITPDSSEYIDSDTLYTISHALKINKDARVSLDLSTKTNIDIIKESTFEGVSSLVSISLPETVLLIAPNAFKDCSITSIIFEDTTHQWYLFKDMNDIGPIQKSV